MINLVAKLGLDRTAFDKGLSGATAQAKVAGGKFGQEYGKEFANSLKQSIAVGAVFGVVSSVMNSAREIRNQAAALGMTSQEFAALELITKRFGDTSTFAAGELDRLIGEVIRAGLVADSESFERMAAGADTFADSLARLKATTMGVGINISALIRTFEVFWKSGMRGVFTLAAAQKNLISGPTRHQFLPSLKAADELWKDWVSNSGEFEYRPLTPPKRVPAGATTQKADRTALADQWIGQIEKMAALVAGGSVDPERSTLRSIGRQGSLINRPVGRLASMGLGFRPGITSFDTHQKTLVELRNIRAELTKQTRIAEEQQ